MWKPVANTIAGRHIAGAALNRLHSPKGLYANTDQTLFVANTLNHRILKYYQGEQLGRRIAGKNISGYSNELLCQPSCVIFSKQLDSVFICDHQNRRVLQYKCRQCRCGKTTVGNEECCGKTSSKQKCGDIVIDNVECRGMAIDDEGFLYVSDTERHEVKRYRIGDSYGELVAGGNGQGARRNQLNRPTFLWIGPDRSLYVSDTWNDRVMKWAPDATEGVVVAGGRGKGGRLDQLDYPSGLVVDRFEAVYVADY